MTRSALLRTILIYFNDGIRTFLIFFLNDVCLIKDNTYLLFDKVCLVKDYPYFILVTTKGLDTTSELIYSEN